MTCPLHAHTHSLQEQLALEKEELAENLQELQAALETAQLEAQLGSKNQLQGGTAAAQLQEGSGGAAVNADVAAQNGQLREALRRLNDLRGVEKADMGKRVSLLLNAPQIAHYH